MEIADLINMSAYNHTKLCSLVFVDNNEALRYSVFLAVLKRFAPGNVLECCFGAVVVFSVTHVWEGQRPCAFL